MKLTASLTAYQIEREQQLETVLALLKRDERVRAAWVFGSLARGSADPLSDVDLIVVVSDEHLPSVISERYAFAHKAGKPIFFLEAPQNAPQGGGYLMICYDAPTAPHIIDVYWQSEALAWDSSQARLLFERSGPAGSAGDTNSLPPDAGEGLLHDVRYFWMMFLIVAKYVCRRPDAPEMHLLPFLTGAYTAVHQQLGQGTLPELENLPVGEPAQKLSVLRELAEGMASLMALLPTRAGDGILPAVYRYLAMVEEAVLFPA